MATPSIQTPLPDEIASGAAPGQLEFTPQQLLANDPHEEPLIAGGVLCHGGFLDGDYVSPRCLFRTPAIQNWQRRLLDEGHALISLPTRYVPPHYPNYAQAKLLLQQGVVDPITRSLTLISIVEGFGARIRDVPLPDLRGEIVENIDGTALAHLDQGLLEAHARDEAGHRSEGGHKQMWEAARDLGLDKPEVPEDVLLQMMSGQRRSRPERAFPDLSERMEALISVMSNVMVIEIFAEDVFEWAKQLLGDPEVSADPAAGAAMVAHIQSDEKPHVQYLRTALSELRARTLRSEDGKREIPGQQVVDEIFKRQLRGMATQRPREQREQLRTEVRQSFEDEARATELARQFDSLDSGWVFPHRDDEPIEILLETA
ncbi:MAG: hypothetical protein JRG76_06265 [Deltaproteobacteria bacterium]|nr:hypothetical protein [Deltaproteobacteria bacterium]MBW2414100.1 hypothetical protein [Deltaproteobacteria bacterium]